jgi:hypothetical protein
LLRNPTRGGQGLNWAIELYDDDDDDDDDIYVLINPFILHAVTTRPYTLAA